MAGYLPEREQYNIQLEYKPGATNCADTLSQRPDYKNADGNPDNKDITVWPDKFFCEEHTAIRLLNINTLESQVKQGQYENQSELECWAIAHNLARTDSTHWYQGTALVVVADNDLRRGVTHLFHDSTTAVLSP